MKDKEKRKHARRRFLLSPRNVLTLCQLTRHFSLLIFPSTFTTFPLYLSLHFFSRFFPLAYSCHRLPKITRSHPYTYLLLFSCILSILTHSFPFHYFRSLFICNRYEYDATPPFQKRGTKRIQIFLYKKSGKKIRVHLFVSGKQGKETETSPMMMENTVGSLVFFLAPSQRYAPLSHEKVVESVIRKKTVTEKNISLPKTI